MWILLRRKFVRILYAIKDIKSTDVSARMMRVRLAFSMVNLVFPS